VEALIAALVSAVTSVTVAALSFLFTSRQQRRSAELLRDPDSRIWFDRIFTFFLETGRGKKTDRALNAISAMENLVGFLDQCVGGGSAIASRWNAEKLSPKEMTVCQADGAAG